MADNKLPEGWGNASDANTPSGWGNQSNQSTSSESDSEQFDVPNVSDEAIDGSQQHIDRKPNNMTTMLVVGLIAVSALVVGMLGYMVLSGDGDGESVGGSVSSVEAPSETDSGNNSAETLTGNDEDITEPILTQENDTGTESPVETTELTMSTTPNEPDIDEPANYSRDIVGKWSFVNSNLEDFIDIMDEVSEFEFTFEFRNNGSVITTLKGDDGNERIDSSEQSTWILRGNRLFFDSIDDEEDAFIILRLDTTTLRLGFDDAYEWIEFRRM
jgi:hypothetical protein